MSTITSIPKPPKDVRSRRHGVRGIKCPSCGQPVLSVDLVGQRLTFWHFWDGCSVLLSRLRIKGE